MRPVKANKQSVGFGTAAFRKWREGQGALYRETLQTTGFHLGRIVIVPREFAPMPSPPLHGRASENRGDSQHAFFRHDGIYRSDVFSTQKTRKTGGGVPPPVGRPRAPVQGRDGRRAPYPSSTMSSGRLFLDRVARQQSPSPLHRQPELNTRAAEPWDKGDISTLRKRGHFYFALTPPVAPLDNGLQQ
jgi:hypothetical protein